MDSDFSEASNSITPVAPGPFFPTPFFPFFPPFFPFFPPFFPFFPPFFPFFPFFPTFTLPPCNANCGGNAACFNCQCNQGGIWDNGVCIA
jgi:hypothetical protein